MSNKNKLDEGNYFLLYANCIPTRGYSRSIIADLQRERIIFIPNGLYELISHFKTKTLNEILTIYTNQGLSKQLLDEYIEYLLDNELGFFTNTPNSFPEIEENYKTPSLIHDVIIEWSEFNFKNIDLLINGLKKTNCKYLEIRSFYNNQLLSQLNSVFNKFEETALRGINIFTSFNSTALDIGEKLINNYPIINEIYFFNADENKKVNNSIYKIAKPFLKTACGQIGDDFFVNLPHFLESKNHNPCLNKKMTISESGIVMNCPNIKSENSYNYVEVDLIQILSNFDFQKKWQITKDQIETCNICEFRYVCGDCRAFVNNYEKPKHCKYNPKTMSYEN